VVLQPLNFLVFKICFQIQLVPLQLGGRHEEQRSGGDGRGRVAERVEVTELVSTAREWIRRNVEGGANPESVTRELLERARGMALSMDQCVAMIQRGKRGQKQRALGAGGAGGGLGAGAAAAAGGLAAAAAAAASERERRNAAAAAGAFTAAAMAGAGEARKPYVKTPVFCGVEVDVHAFHRIVVQRGGHEVGFF
jgi:hypothetical protein